MRIRRWLIASVATGATLLSGCAQTRPYSDLWVEHRPLRADVPSVRPPQDTLRRDRPAGLSVERVRPSGTIALGDAVALALRHNPLLEASGWSVLAAEADAMQQGRPPNPVAGLSVENFGGPDGLQELPRQTLRISQVIELGGKRSKRQRLGEAKQRLEAWDYEQSRLDIAATTATRYVAALAAQQRIVLGEQQRALAESAFDVAEERSANGTRPSYERDQAAARLALLQIELDQSKQRLAAALADLAASWGGELSDDLRVSGDLRIDTKVPSLQTLLDRLSQSPRVARWDDEIAMRERAIALQRANAVTDPRIGGGVRYLSDLDETVGVAEVSWPLPLLDTNEHGVLAARLRLSQTVAQQAAAKTEASRQLRRAYSRAAAGEATLSTLRDEAIPAATAAFASIREAFDAGQAEYLAALEAEQSLLALRSLELEAALALHTAVIEIEQLTATPITE